MPLQPRFDPSDLGPRELRERLPGTEQERRRRSSGWLIADGALACPACNLPIALSAPSSPSDPEACPFCAHTAPLREFLRLDATALAGRVEVVARFQ